MEHKCKESNDIDRSTSTITIPQISFIPILVMWPQHLTTQKMLLMLFPFCGSKIFQSLSFFVFLARLNLMHLVGTLNIFGFCKGLEFAGFRGKLAMEPASLVAFGTSAAASSTVANRSFAWQQVTPKRMQLVVMASKSGAKLVSAGCKTCKGKGAVECEGCKGTGRNKKNGNIFERWKCFDCQGFGMRGCPSCAKRGLTPEQRGER